jgi:hypothetical protein
MRSSTLALGLVLASGCAQLLFTPSGTPLSLVSKDPNAVVLYFSPSQPKCAFDVVGLYEYRTPGGQSFAIDKQSIDKLKSDAAGRGFDGLMEVRCAPPGTVGQGTCTAKAFVCRTGA